MGAEGKYDLRLVGTSLETDSTVKCKSGAGVLTGRKSNSTPSLPDCTDTAMHNSVASTDQAASADNLAAKVIYFYSSFFYFILVHIRMSIWKNRENRGLSGILFNLKKNPGILMEFY